MRRSGCSHYRAVADELVKLGVAKENIVVKANGGVKDLTPASYNRRATVQVGE